MITTVVARTTSPSEPEGKRWKPLTPLRRLKRIHTQAQELNPDDFQTAKAGRPLFRPAQRPNTAPRLRQPWRHSQVSNTAHTTTYTHSAGSVHDRKHRPTRAIAISITNTAWHTRRIWLRNAASWPRTISSGCSGVVRSSS